MSRPSLADLELVGFTELQIILISDVPDDVAWEAYYRQIENIMTDENDEVTF